MRYGLKYTIPFKTLSDLDCVVELHEIDYTGATIELKAGATPLVIDTETVDVLKPIRGSGATIEVFGGSYLQDLYTSNPLGIKVIVRADRHADIPGINVIDQIITADGYYIEVSDSSVPVKVENVVYWVGYVIQDTFSQDFSNPEFTYQIECVSGVSALKNKKFSWANSSFSFLDIIKDAYSIAGYKNALLTDTVRSTYTGNIYSDFGVATANFIDELGEVDTYYDILAEIATFTTCQFTPYRDSLMLINYEIGRASCRERV